jgi:hypothetical protein
MDKLEIKRLFYTTNPVFYTSGNRFVRRKESQIFSLVLSDNRNTNLIEIRIPKKFSVFFILISFQALSRVFWKF